MNIIENDTIKDELIRMKDNFSFYKENLLHVYELCKSNVSSWEYSLGINRDMIPFENIIPSISGLKGKNLSKLTKSNIESKNLVSYGVDKNGKVVFLKRKFHKDVEKYGENIRIVVDDFILNIHAYESQPEKNKLLSICHVYEKDGFNYYVFITPPHDWFVRIDNIDDNVITHSYMFSNNWFKQIDFDLLYNDSGMLSKIMIGDFLHWKNE